MSGFYSIDPFYTLNSTGQTPAINDNLGLNVAPSGTAMTGGMMVNQMLMGSMAPNTDTDNESIQDGHNFFGPNARHSPRTSDNMQSFQNRPYDIDATAGDGTLTQRFHPAGEEIPTPPDVRASYQNALASRLRYEAQNPANNPHIQTIRSNTMRTPQDRAQVQQAVDQVLNNPFASASMLHEALKALFECLKRNRAGLGEPQSDGTIPRHARLHASDVGAIREQAVQHFLDATAHDPQAAAAAQEALDRFLS